MSVNDCCRHTAYVAPASAYVTADVIATQVLPPRGKEPTEFPPAPMPVVNLRSVLSTRIGLCKYCVVKLLFTSTNNPLSSYLYTDILMTRKTRRTIICSYLSLVLKTMGISTCILNTFAASLLDVC